MLRTAGVRAGDEVVVPAYGSVEVTEAVVRVGAVPVYADVDADSYCLDPAAVEAAVTARTAAIVAVHRFGCPADLGRLRAIGRRHGLLVADRAEPGEDAAGAAARRAHAEYLAGRLTGVVAPTAAEGHTYEEYVVRVPGNGRPDRDAFARALRARRVGCIVPVPVPVHRIPGFRRDVFLPETERAADETLSLPVTAGMSRRELHRMVSACNALGGLLQPAF